MNKKANEITASQVLVFVISSQISFGILSLASSLAEKVGHDGWISVLLAGLIVSGMICIMVAMLQRFKNLSLLDINIHIFGKYFGVFLNLLIVCYLLYTTVLSLRLFTDIITISALRITPGIVIASFIIIPTVYISWYGLKYICRISTSKLILLIIVVLYYFLLSKYFRLTFLEPLGVVGLKKIIKGAYIPYLSYIGFELVTIIYPYIKDKENVLNQTLLGNLISILFYAITVFFLTGFFGENMLKHLQYPIFSLARAYRAPVLERLDLFFIALWFPIMGTVLQCYYFCTYHSLKKIFRIENDKNRCALLISLFTVVLILLSRLPKDMGQVKKLFDILGYMGSAYLGYIMLCYIISFFVKLGGKNHEKAT